MKKLSILLIACIFCLVGCGSSGSEKIVVGGSTSVQPVMEKLAHSYNEETKKEVEVQAGGSTVGFTQTKNGVFQLGMLSRDLKDSEKNEVESTEIALDGIVVIVSKENEVSDLTLAQVKDIYTGKIANWKELGGKDLAITVISREAGSGTRGAFEEIAGFKASELIDKAQIQNSTGAVESSVKSNPNAIGYISLGSLKDDVKAMNINGVKASVETIKSKDYKLARPFMIVWKKDDTQTKEFRDFILSDKGQKIITDNKYISVK